MNEYQTLINIVGTGALATMGWFARQLWDSVKSLKEDLASFKTKVAEDYTPKDDFKDFAKELRAMFTTINDKLDRKADK